MRMRRGALTLPLCWRAKSSPDLTKTDKEGGKLTFAAFSTNGSDAQDADKGPHDLATGPLRVTGPLWVVDILHADEISQEVYNRGSKG